MKDKPGGNSNYAMNNTSSNRNMAASSSDGAINESLARMTFSSERDADNSTSPNDHDDANNSQMQSVSQAPLNNDNTAISSFTTTAAHYPSQQLVSAVASLNNDDNLKVKPPPSAITKGDKTKSRSRSDGRRKSSSRRRQNQSCSSSQASLRAGAPSPASIARRNVDNNAMAMPASSASPFVSQFQPQESINQHSQQQQLSSISSSNAGSAAAPDEFKDFMKPVEPKGEWKPVEIATESQNRNNTIPNSSTFSFTQVSLSSAISTSSASSSSTIASSSQQQQHLLPSDPPPSQRSLHAAAVYKDNFLIFGGYDGESRRNDFYLFNLTEKKWRRIEALGEAPSPRDRHTAFVYKDCFYVFGGFDGTSRINDFYCYNFKTNTWQEIEHDMINGSPPPTPRHSHTAVVYKDSVYIFAGYDGSYRSDFHQYNFQSNTWSHVPPSGRTPRARYRATCVVHDDYMILFGGHDGTRHLSDTHIFCFLNSTWTPGLQIGGTPPLPRDSHVSVMYGNAMYVFGGSAGSRMNDLYELSLGSSSTEGGGNGGSSGSIRDETFIPTWRTVSCTGAISHRFCHVGAVFEDSLYVFGGYDGTSRLNDFMQFEFNVDDLAYEIPPSTLVADMKSFLDNETLFDVTFIVEGQPVHAHKIMLMRCSYFRAMLAGNMMEAHQSEIYLEEVSHPIFILLLEYLYTDIVHIPVEDAMELFVAADLFGVPRLQAMCEKKMLECIHVDNAATIFHAADFHNANLLRSKALKYILTHFESVSKSESFEEMARGNVELVVEILRLR